MDETGLRSFWKFSYSKKMEHIFSQLCSRIDQTNSHLSDMSKKMDLIQQDFKTCIVNQGRENAMIEALSRVNDTLIANNIELRKRLGEYKEAPPAPPEGNLILSDHDEQNLIITGKTFDFKDMLKQNFSVTWNSSPKGWLCPKEQKDAIIQLCAEKKIECVDQSVSPPASPPSGESSFKTGGTCIIR